MISNDNYITISGWMINELGLKGNELIVYALIYGFSQDGRTEFNGSISYIQDWLGTSRSTTVRIIQNLVDAGVVVKKQENINGVKFNKYVAVRGGSSKIEPLVSFCNEGSSILEPNNNINNIYINNNKYIYTDFIPPTLEEVRQFVLANNIPRVNPDEWYSYYKSTGWMIGKQKMTDWKESIMSWSNGDIALKKLLNKKDMIRKRVKEG